VNSLVDLGSADETGFPHQGRSIPSTIGSIRTRARWWSTFEAAAAKDAGSIQLDMLVNNAGIAPAVSLMIKRQGQSSMTSPQSRSQSISKPRFLSSRLQPLPPARAVASRISAAFSAREQLSRLYEGTDTFLDGRDHPALSLHPTSRREHLNTCVVQLRWGTSRRKSRRHTWPGTDGAQSEAQRKKLRRTALREWLSPDNAEPHTG
jgi:hypothetical protein